MLVLRGLLDGVRAACVDFPDKRRGGEVTYLMEDIRQTSAPIGEAHK